jgi:hypothetical protein
MVSGSSARVAFCGSAGEFDGVLSAAAGAFLFTNTGADRGHALIQAHLGRKR